MQANNGCGNTLSPTFTFRTTGGTYSLSDPVDSGVDDDIATLDVTVANGQITLHLKARDTMDFNHHAYFWIDSDQDPTTGDSVRGDMAGYDYLVSCDNYENHAGCQLATLPLLFDDVEEKTDFANIPGASSAADYYSITAVLPLAALGDVDFVDVFASTYSFSLGIHNSAIVAPTQAYSIRTSARWSSAGLRRMPST